VDSRSKDSIWREKKKILNHVKERRNFRGHKGEVTCIEIYKSQNVIITGGTDKKLFIRKIYDFELLTVIDLIYSYGNPFISQNDNIVPTLIRVSELNCIYVLLHNYESNKSFIRGYNLNGIFFKQSAEDYYTNYTFTKNGNLMISKANSSNIYLFNCYDLEEIKDIELSVANILDDCSNIKSHDKIVWFDYNYLSRELILMFDNSIYKGNLEEEQQRNIDCY
jgi:WD40 repeat protein